MSGTHTSPQRGFTLVELMIVIAIMGVLATMAVPTYQERFIRAQVGEALALADFAKDSVNAYYRVNKRMPKSNAEAGLPPPDKIVGNYVTALEVADGAIHVKLGHRVNKNAAGKVLSLRPAAVVAHPQVPLAWNCGAADPPAAMKAFGANQTDLPSQYLPVDCRS